LRHAVRGRRELDRASGDGVPSNQPFRSVSERASQHRIAVYKPADDGIEPWLNLSDAAKLLQVTPKTLRFAALHFHGTCYHQKGSTKSKTPRGIAFRSAKLVLLNDIDRWVL
jgi:hypothetical protein